MADPPLPDEFALIERYFAPLAAGHAGAFGLADDAATLAVEAADELVVTKDLLVAGVHFPGDDPPELLGRKLLRVNLSDLAAMGAAAKAYALGLALPRGTASAWLEAFAAGLAADQAEYGVVLLGGDTVATDGPLVLSLTAFGTVPRGGALHRAGARPGDHVWVSGTIGDGALGLRVLRRELDGLAEAERAQLMGRYRLPQPRLALGERLIGLAHAAIDISDGLIADLNHVCEVSNVAAEIDVAHLPLSAAARSALEVDLGLLETVLTGGDDYELLFCAGPEAAKPVEALAQALDLPLTRIGAIRTGAGVRVRGPGGRPARFGQGGYRHF
jgi:thiamine-monophosphate kinase